MNALKELKNEQALDVLGDLLEPIQRIVNNEEVKKTHEAEGSTYFDHIKAMIKNCQKEVIAIIATIDGVPVEEADYSAMMIFKKLIELFSDDDFKSFFM